MCRSIVIESFLIPETLFINMASEAVPVPARLVTAAAPVKTCLHGPHCNNKLLQMADIHVQDRAEVTAVCPEMEGRLFPVKDTLAAAAVVVLRKRTSAQRKRRFTVRGQPSPANICGMSHLFLFLRSLSSRLPLNCAGTVATD